MDVPYLETSHITLEKNFPPLLYVENVKIWVYVESPHHFNMGLHWHSTDWTPIYTLMMDQMTHNRILLKVCCYGFEATHIIVTMSVTSCNLDMV